MKRTLKIKNNKLQFEDYFDIIIEKKVTKFGTGAKVDCPKEFIGRDVYIIIKSK